jgi:hypothetical protein
MGRVERALASSRAAGSQEPRNWAASYQAHIRLIPNVDFCITCDSGHISLIQSIDQDLFDIGLNA